MATARSPRTSRGGNLLRSALGLSLALIVALPSLSVAASATPATETPIQHLVVIFQENVSFDHYFGTYPKAANTSGTQFDPSLLPTPPVANLANTKGAGGVGTLLTNNPNKDAGGHQVNPRRYDPANIDDVLTCSQDHEYTDEQKAFHGGAMDQFVTATGTATGKSGTGRACSAGDVMNYFDGNTVTALWNYAQHFAMSDNSYGTTFGPSTPGAINLISGNTGGIDLSINGAATNGETVPDGIGGASIVEDPQPYYDDCSTRDAVSLKGKNVGDLLNTAGVSWGWFQGGFRPSTPFATARAAIGKTADTATFTPDEFSNKFVTPPASNQGICNTVHPVGAAIGGTGSGTSSNYGNKDDYIPHHEPFQYYASTANPHHLPPASISSIGTDTQTFNGTTPQFNTANHQYDMSDFDSLVGAISRGYLSPDHLPAVSFLKAPGNQDGHAGYSDPFDEQQFIVREINALQSSPAWSSTAVIVSYDDSDGWYDHVFSGVHNPSNTSATATPPGPQDFLNGIGLCGSGTPLAGQNGRCGYGPRMPLLAISPWAKSNFVDHTLTDQSSILAFVEQNWHLPKIAGSFDAIAGPLTNMFDFNSFLGGHAPKLVLDPGTGACADPGFLSRIPGRGCG